MMGMRSHLERLVFFAAAILCSLIVVSVYMAQPSRLPVAHSGTIKVPSAPIAIGIQNACAVPVVVTGAITAASPTQSGRLYRDGLVGTCGQTGSCVISDTAPYPYQEFDFTNNAGDAQCVSATIDASACTGDIYSTAYLGAFDSNNICAHYLSAMGLSTPGVFTYSFLVPASAAFSIVNTTAPSNTLCTGGYHLTVRPCSANIAATASLTLTGAPFALANDNGTAVITYNLSYKNTGNYTTVIPSASVLMTPLAQSTLPNLVFIDYGHAGGLVAPGKTITQNVAVISTSSARNLCLPTYYTLTTQMGAQASVYQCNWGNPAQQTLTNQTLAEQNITGTVQPSPWLAENRYAFGAQAGWSVSITVQTLSAATTFDPMACLSAMPDGPCLPNFTADDSIVCDFQPHSITSTYTYCPVISGTLPLTPDGLFYLRVTSYSASGFAGTVGQFRATIRLMAPSMALCPTVQVLDDGMRSFHAPISSQPEATQATSAWVSASAPPVVVSVPPLNPYSSSCTRLSMPIVRR
ncbi:MAG TPA: hypothetical protein VGK87_04060 [Anaerolineae bacterium]|jgi:hypothetical protein